MNTPLILPGIERLHDPRGLVAERLAEAVELFNGETFPEVRVQLFREIQILRCRLMGVREIETGSRLTGRGLWAEFDEDLAVGAVFEGQPGRRNLVSIFGRGRDREL